MTVPEARKDRVLRRYQLRRHRVPVAASGNLSIVCPSGSTELLEGDLLKRCTRRPHDLPYWADIWPSSVALARHLLRQQSGDAVGGASVLDLGCGVGVAAAGAARAGARVTCADRESDAVAFATFNSRHNGCPEPIGREFDWDLDTFDRGFDFVLLADVTYHHRLHGGVERQLREVLGSGSQALHTDPMRPESADFLRRLEPDFRVAIEEISVGWDGQRVAVRLARIERR